MAHGTPTGPDSGFDVNEPAYAADSRAALPATASTVPKINLRFAAPKPKLATAAPRHEHHAPVATSSRPAPFVQPVVSQTPVVSRSTLSGIPLPSCVA